jgi:enoyl-CoA hydratase
MPITKTLEGDIALLRMDFGRGNAISLPFIDAMHAALDEVKDARAVVITGQGKVFSGGLDLPAIHAYDRAECGAFVDAFEGLFRRIYSFECPLVAAVNGHAIAGGYILAMSCDYRVVAEGNYLLGANEAQLGIPFPAAAHEIVYQATPVGLRGAVMLQGKRFSPAEALISGIVQRMAADPVAAALEEARQFAAAGAEAVRDIKRDLVAPVLARIDATSKERRERFLDHWDAGEAKARIAKVMAELAARKK